ncbi:DUF3885 domain-containing protein [Anaerovorax sp. IOR16]|uniref:DUF3885 domain-containing protein n=1 Tax=Anaerovorax sp. IOR16 TaxID=2773458 RepID=UPI0019D1D54E|nr:DUF3885 domain-containing protein [Anaerovorax sp. IOR16]
MGTLADIFFKTLHRIGMDCIKHPIFYNAPIGIRFEIGGDEGVYLTNTYSHELAVNPEYVSAALHRAKTIYENLPQNPNVLRIDAYPNYENNVQDIILSVCKAVGLPQPHEQVIEPFQWDEDDEVISQLQLYWDLKTISFSSDKVLQEIIKADIGGCIELVSSVYFVDTINSVLFHLYDDKGLDLIAADKEQLRPIFNRFNNWILDYDKKEIDRTFSEITSCL